VQERDVPIREAFLRLLEHLSTHDQPDAGCPRCALLRAAYQQDFAERIALRAGAPPQP